MRQRSRIPAARNLADRARELGLANGRDRFLERTRQRATAGTVENAFERIAPQRDAPVAIDDAHSLLERTNHLAAPALLFDPVDVGAVGAIREIQRHGHHRNDLPGPVLDDLDQPHRKTRTHHVRRNAAEERSRP